MSVFTGVSARHSTNPRTRPPTELRNAGVTLNRTEVKGREPAGEIPSDLMADVDVGLRLALEL